ncbi:MAG: fasciclin domain-containing protein [Maribacter sp.]|nr:fasciclin domain-containing protein [Maribacter sp.]
MKYLATPLSLLCMLMSFSAFAQSTQVTGVRFESDPNKSIFKNTENSKNHKTLLTAIRAADLEEILNYDGPFTIFAPSDSAFESLSQNAFGNLLKPENKKRLQDVLTYHIIAGNLTASKILRAMCRGNGKAIFTTVQGEDLTATMSGIDIILTDALGHTAKIILADSNQCNGVIHEIDSVILPIKI